MNKKLLMGVAAFCVMGLSVNAWAADAATADEVVTKVKEAAADLKANGEAALPAYNDPKGQWAWKDTYVFVMDCAAGTMVAHPSDAARGLELTKIKDKETDKEIGTALCAAAEQPNGGWVEYMWTKPGAEGNFRKIAYVLSGGKYAAGAGVYDDKLTAAELEAKTK